MIDLLAEKQVTTAAIALAALLAGCGENNTYVAPPPPKVDGRNAGRTEGHALFRSRPATRRRSTRPIWSRASPASSRKSLQDGQPVKKGDHLFTIEPEPYQLKLQQAQAAQAGAEATLTQAQADFDRQTGLVARQSASKAQLDNATANRDAAKAKVLQAQADTQTGADQPRLHARGRAVRRHRHREAGLDRRTGRRFGHPGARDDRPAQPDPRRLQRQRARRAESARHAGQARPCRRRSARQRGRGRPADRCRLSAQGQARLHRPAGEPGNRHARRPRRCCRTSSA